MWNYSETGCGRPLILLHGIGMSHAAWNAVTPYLRSTRRVIAFDIAGFGLTPPLPGGTLPTISNLVDGLDRSIREIGIEVPVDMAGNSLGGCMALEAARRGIARTVVAISPAGLWRRRGAPHVKYVFGGLRYVTRTFPNLSKATMRVPWLRELALAVPISVGSRRMPASDALRAVDDLATVAGLRRDVRQHSPSFFRRRHHRAGHRGVWRSRLDPAEGLTISTRSSGTHQVDQKARLGSCADVGRSGRCLAADPGGHTIGLVQRWPSRSAHSPD